MTKDTRIDALAEEITNYLRAHPNAADTVDGVMKWWLREGRSSSTQEIARVLELLVVRGVLVRKQVTGGGQLYSAGPQIRRDMEGGKEN